MRLLLAGLLAAALGWPQSPAGAPRATFHDKSVVEAHVRHLMLWPSNAAVSVSEEKAAPVAGWKAVEVTGRLGNARQTISLFIADDGSKAIRGTLLDVAVHPFAATTAHMDLAFAPSLGPADAPVTLVEYGDFTCADCAKASEILRTRAVKDFPAEVRVLFRDNPAAGNPLAQAAAVAGRCVARENQERFWAYAAWAYGQAPSLDPPQFRTQLTGFLQDAGLDARRILSCYDKRETEADILKSVAEASLVEAGTIPAVFLNGRRLHGPPVWDQWKLAIEAEIAFRKSTGIAAGDCGCQLTLPSVFPQ